MALTPNYYISGHATFSRRGDDVARTRRNVADFSPTTTRRRRRLPIQNRRTPPERMNYSAGSILKEENIGGERTGE